MTPDDPSGRKPPTWGQLRFNILQSSPGISITLVDEWLNSRYEQVLQATDWTGLHAETTLQTVAAIESDTDTVDLTVGSNAVAGLGTAFTSNMVGRRFYRPGDNPVYTIAACSIPTAITLDRPYEGRANDPPGVVYEQSPYVVMQHVYPLPEDCRAIERLYDATYQYPMEHMTAGELAESGGPVTHLGDPKIYAEVEDTPEVIGQTTLHQVQLSPAPRYARGHVLEYLRDPFLFNGLNLRQSPLPFVSTAALMYGVRADIALYQGKIQLASAYESKFKTELTALLQVEHSQRRTPATIRMAPRFTRHRMERAVRGYGRGWADDD
jgi:hypothetical protein